MVWPQMIHLDDMIARPSTKDMRVIPSRAIIEHVRGRRVASVPELYMEYSTVECSQAARARRTHVEHGLRMMVQCESLSSVRRSGTMRSAGYGRHAGVLERRGNRDSHDMDVSSVDLLKRGGRH